MVDPVRLSVDRVRELAPAEIFERGQELWQTGAVRHATRQGSSLQAEAQGTATEPYRMMITFGPQGVTEASCTCPFFATQPRRQRQRRPAACKHLVALLLLWVHNPADFETQPTTEEALAGANRGAVLAEVRAMLRQDPAVADVLAQPPEQVRRHQPLNPQQVEKQINYALARHRKEPAKLHERLAAIREEGVSLFQQGYAADAARLLTLLMQRLIPLFDLERERQPDQLETLVRDTLAALELAALDAEWPTAERQRWLQTLMDWWAEGRHGLGDPLMDIILHSYHPDDADLVEGWLRRLLRSPRQAGVVHETWQRERILHFLLAFYTALGRHQAFLDLCWEEDEDAQAALRLAELGRVDEAATLATQGLGGAGAHEALAAHIWAQGHPETALQVAEAGLRYRDAWRPGLLDWLATHLQAQGHQARAVALAQEAWTLAPSLARYRALRTAVQGDPTQESAAGWPTLAATLQEALRTQHQQALLTEILLDEGHLTEAAAVLPTVTPEAVRQTLTLATAQALLAAGQASAAVPLFFEAAELLAAGRTRVHYARAAALIATARAAVGTQSGDHFDTQLHAFLVSHQRRPALLEEVGRALEAQTEEEQ